MGSPLTVECNPQVMLPQGSRVLTLQDTTRLFAIRKVFYDESLTPLYALPSLLEKRYTSLEDIGRDNPKQLKLLDAVILDKDNYLKVWSNA